MIGRIFWNAWLITWFPLWSAYFLFYDVLQTYFPTFLAQVSFYGMTDAQLATLSALSTDVPVPTMSHHPQVQSVTWVYPLAIL